MNHKINTQSRAFRFTKSVRTTIIRADRAVFSAGESVANTFRDLRAGWRSAKVDDAYEHIIKPAAARAANLK